MKLIGTKLFNKLAYEFNKNYLNSSGAYFLKSPVFEYFDKLNTIYCWRNIDCYINYTKTIR